MSRMGLHRSAARCDGDDVLLGSYNMCLNPMHRFEGCLAQGKNSALNFVDTASRHSGQGSRLYVYAYVPRAHWCYWLGTSTIRSFLFI